MGSVVEANPGNWNQEVLKSSMLTVVYFWHERCPWCFRLNPIFNEIVEEYDGKIEFVKLNVLEFRKSGISHKPRSDGHSDFDVFLSGKAIRADCELHAERRVGNDTRRYAWKIRALPHAKLGLKKLCRINRY